MRSKSFVITLVVFVQLFLVSCQTTQQKILEFVDKYNQSASFYTNDVINYTNAKAFVKDKKIEITYFTKLEGTKELIDLGAKIFPGLVSDLLKKEKITSELIEEGIVFNVFFVDKSYAIISEIKVDKNSIHNLLNQNKISPANSSPLSNSNSNSVKEEAIAIMNKNLPVDYGDGTKLMKIKLGNDNDIIYVIEVPEDLTEILKSEKANALLKDEIFRSVNFKQIIGAVGRLNISAIKYDYVDSKGKVLNTVVFDKNDFR